MFNLYQHMNKQQEKEHKEPETTGHDRFYQERSRSSFRKKKRRGGLACRRAQSVSELQPRAGAMHVHAHAHAHPLAQADKLLAFRVRSVSSERDESEEESSERTPLVAQKIDSLAKLLFHKSIISPGSGASSARGSPSDPSASPRSSDKSVENSAALAICLEYLSCTPRYELIAQLNRIGSRPHKHWFAVTDNSIKTERLLALMPLRSGWGVEASEQSRQLMVQIFRALIHPYIYPVLDVAFHQQHALVVVPFNPRGSLKDLIYKSVWGDEYTKKYEERGTGLPAWQVCRLARQILEGLIFLQDKGFPPFLHLHSGNVMMQNGVARITGLENTLLCVRQSGWGSWGGLGGLDGAETLALGGLVFEMCAGYELPPPCAGDPLEALLPLQDAYPQVCEVLGWMLGAAAAAAPASAAAAEAAAGTAGAAGAAAPPTLHQLLLCEPFRKIDLREMKGSCLPNFTQRLSASCLGLLEAVARRQGAPPHPPPPPRDRYSQSAHASPAPRRREYGATHDFAQEW